MGLAIPSVGEAVWMMRALVAANVLARREGETLFVPVNAAIDPAGELLAPRVALVHRLAMRRRGQEVRQELAAGKTASEVEAGLYYRFGDSIRSEPKTSGVGLLAWVLPGCCCWRPAPGWSRGCGARADLAPNRPRSLRPPRANCDSAAWTTSCSTLN